MKSLYTTYINCCTIICIILWKYGSLNISAIGRMLKILTFSSKNWICKITSIFFVSFRYLSSDHKSEKVIFGGLSQVHIPQKNPKDFLKYIDIVRNHLSVSILNSMFVNAKILRYFILLTI